MYMPYVSEFIEFLSVKDHSLEEILAHMVLRVLRPLNATSAFLSELNRDNKVENLGGFGIRDEVHTRYGDSVNLQDHLPLTDAIRNRCIVWINTLPEWPLEYAILQNLPYETGERTLICFPIEKCGTPVAALGIFCDVEVDPSAEIDAFLKAIGNLFSLHLYRNLPISGVMQHVELRARNESSSSESSKLTERQILILRMISESRTNSAISDLLGYSESTIRQETIKIYAILKCNGRQEASRIYAEKFSH